MPIPPGANVRAAAELMGRPAAHDRRRQPAERLAVDALPWVATRLVHPPLAMDHRHRCHERVPVAIVAAAGGPTSSTGPGVCSALTKTLEGMPALPVVVGAQPAPPGSTFLPAPPVDGAQLEELLATRGRRRRTFPASSSARIFSPARAWWLMSVRQKHWYCWGTLLPWPPNWRCWKNWPATVGLAGYSEVDLTVPQRPALTPVPN